jgi:predicted enzyme involved in methoxymalonyl-ACP biosynthesis
MLEKASGHQIKRVEAEYIRTEKNALVADLYDRLGAPYL